MAEGPSEAWLRDVAFEDPHIIWGRICGKRDGSIYRWKEYPTDAGRIDLLLAIPGRVLVVEFKRDVADESAVAQVLRYKGVLRQTLAADIFCAVVAPRFTPQCLFAAEAALVHTLAIVPTYDVDSVAVPEATMEHAQLSEIADADINAAIEQHFLNEERPKVTLVVDSQATDADVL